MIKIIPILSLLILVPFHNCLYGQECELKYRYEKVLGTYDEKWNSIVQMYENDKYMNGNKAALIKESIDTLNKSEIVFTKFVNGTVIEKETSWIGISGGRKENDTLTIFIGDILSNEVIKHTIFNRKVKTYFEEWYDYEEWLKLSKDENPTNNLKIEVFDNEFQICQEGNVFYGYSKMKVGPYFRLDRYNEKQFLEIQRNYEYYFKFEIQ